MRRRKAEGGRRMALLAGVLALCGDCSANAAVASLDDIQYWVGAGPNRAGVAIDWDGDRATDEALAWGFRWDGAATGEDMLRAVIAADARLFAKLGDNGPLGIAVRGLGYDANDDGAFALDDGTQFDGDGVAPSGPTDGAQSVDEADRYREGWFTGVWSYAIANANPWSGDAAWAYSAVGATGRPLVDGAWDSWAFTATFRQTAFAANASPAMAPALVDSADFDANGAIDGNDFLAWQRGLGLNTGAVRADGDANADGAVDAIDLAAWRAQFGTSTAASASRAVPEPLTYGTCAIAIVFVFWMVRSTLMHLRRWNS
jgi:hypothetical protein